MNLAQLADCYACDGYLIMPRVLSEADCQGLLQKLEAAFASESWLDLAEQEKPDEDRHAGVRRRVERLDEIAPERRRLLLSETIQAPLRVLMEDEPALMSQNIPFRYGPAHSSFMERGRPLDRNAHVHHYSHIEPERACVMAWLALEDIVEEAGPMWVAPGSHLINKGLFDNILAENPDLDKELIALRCSGADYITGWVNWFTRMQSIMTERLEDSIPKRERIPILIGQGDIVLFDPALSHGTIPPTNLDRTRWSIVAKYKGQKALEWSWASWFGSSIYAPALEHISPATFETAKEAEGLYAVDPMRDHLKMFWTKPLPASET